LPRGAGGLPQVPHHTRASRPALVLSAAPRAFSRGPFDILPLAGADHGLYGGAVAWRERDLGSGSRAPPRSLQQLWLGRAVGAGGGPPPVGPGPTALPPSWHRGAP